MTRWQSTGIIIFSSIFLMLSGTPFVYSADHQVVAVIDGKEISNKALADEIAAYGKKGDFQAKLLTLTPEGKKKILNNLLRELLFYQAALDTGVKLDVETEKRLQELRRDLVVRKYIQSILEKASATDGEIYDYYLKHKADYVVPEKRKMRHIVVKSREEAEGLRKRLVDGGDFKILAKAHNIDGSRQKEGDLGWVEKGIMVKDFEDVAFSLPQHQPSRAVKTEFGYHLILVEEIITPVQKSYRDVTKEIKAKLEKDAMDEIEARLREKYNVKVNYNGLDARTEKKQGFALLALLALFALQVRLQPHSRGALGCLELGCATKVAPTVAPTVASIRFSGTSPHVICADPSVFSSPHSFSP